MNPKEKAIEIYDKMFNIIHINEEQKYYDSADKAALIFIDEIINTLFQHHEIDYWKEVKEEVKKL